MVGDGVLAELAVEEWEALVRVVRSG